MSREFALRSPQTPCHSGNRGNCDARNQRKKFPLRIAVVDEKPASSKTVVTKLILIPVEVRSADDNPSFTHVEDNVTFPMPSSSELDNYLVYIGFDPIAAQAQERHVAPRARPKAKRKPKDQPGSAPLSLRTN